MSTTQDLMGLGMPGPLASRLGNTPASYSGAGTAQTGATSIASPVAVITPTSSNTAFVLTSAFSTGRPIWVWNQSSSQTALVYPPTGGTINGGSANASVSVPPLSGATFQLYNGSGNAAETWGCNFGGTVSGILTPTFNSVTINAGSATVTPLTLTAGTVNTTPVAGGIEYDGKVFYADLAANDRSLIVGEYFIYAQAAITLLSQTAAQPAFVGTGGVLTLGEITLPTGTYEFDSAFNISGISATSGGFGFSITATSPAVIGQQSWEAYANKATLATPAAWQSSWNTAASTELVTATTATVGFARIRGSFTITTAGPIVPNLSFTTITGAPTPIVGVGSYFRVNPLGSATVTFIGNWS